jgi:hypothetical protein
MADDRDARIARLEAEFQQLRERHAEEIAQRDTALAEAVEQQTATAEVLRVIATSPTDLSSVLDAIVSAARRLINAEHASLNQLDGDILTWTASSYAEDISPEHRDRFERVRPASTQTRVDSRSVRGRTIRE